MGVKRQYSNMISELKAEYPDFECWKIDMLKSGVFKKFSN